MNSLNLANVATDLQARFDAWKTTVVLGDAVLALLFALVVVTFRKPLAHAVVAAISRLLRTMSIDLVPAITDELRDTVRIILVTVSVFVLVDTLALPSTAGEFLERLFASILVLAVFSTWYKLIGPFMAIIDPQKFSNVRVDTSWMERIGQFAVVLFAITALLTVWDIDISSALTGVGVLGAGLAIAAQDFIRNLFGGMNNMSEKRFETGDWISVEGVIEGTVSSVDVRSTVVMGFDRVPRYVPNSELSNAIVLNKSRMDHRRIYWLIPIKLDATEAQLDGICGDLKDYLHSCGDFVDDAGTPLIASVTGLSDSAVEILVYCFTTTKVYQDYLEVCGRLTNAVRAAVSGNDARIAYRTHAVAIDDAALNTMTMRTQDETGEVHVKEDPE